MRLLLVEDEAKLASYVAKGLKQHGYSVETSPDGEDALFKALHGNHDLVILDLMLPKVDGLTVLRRMRDRGVEVPVIILTAKDKVDDRVVGLDTGADDYLVKPFAFSELVARVNACLRRRSRPLVNELQVADLKLDLLTRRAERAGKRIELTDIECRLLALLMRHPGEVLTRVQITEHVWNYQSETFDSVIDVHMHNLRRKVDHGHDKKLLHTIRGVGYVCEEQG